MLRCNEVAGKYEISCDYLDGSYGTPRVIDIKLDIGTHRPVYGEVEGVVKLIEDIPYCSKNKPYVGEICIHELDWVQHMPGKTYSARRRYYTKQLDNIKTKEK